MDEISVLMEVGGFGKKIGIIGYSESRHPYSFSSIFNGFNEQEFMRNGHS